MTRVDFFAGTQLLGSVTAPPYSLTWDTAAGMNMSVSLVSKTYDAAGNVGTSGAVPVTVNNPGWATYDPTPKAPRCSTVYSNCDTGTMIQGAGSGGAEVNQPNTINSSCSDGPWGCFHIYESLDRLRVIRLDGTNLAPGKRVRIDADVWVHFSSGDALDLYHAADATNPSWTYLTTLTRRGRRTASRRSRSSTCCPRAPCRRSAATGGSTAPPRPAAPG